MLTRQNRIRVGSLAICGLLILSENASAWTWGDVFADIAKGVIVALVVDKVNASTATHNSETNLVPEPKPAPNLQADPYARARAIARAHFMADSYCNTDEIMALYAKSVYYENEQVDLSDLRNVKEGYCKKFRRDASFSIKNNQIQVSPFSQDKTITLIDYAVDFDVYHIKKNRRFTGSTAVRLAIRDDKIIAESHKKLTY